MKKRVLSLFMVLVLCLTLLPTAAFAEGEDGSISGGVIGGGETGGEGGGVLVPPGGSTGEGGGIYVPPGSPTEGGGGTYIPGEDTRTEIWCVSKPDSIGRSYDGTTDGGRIPINLTFTDGTNEIEFKEGTDFSAVKTFDSADAGWHTVTVEITLIGEAAAKYKLKAGEEKFEIGGNINKAYPDLTVSLSRATCAVGEKLLPLLSVSGVKEDAAVTYYYTQYKTIAGDSEYEGSEAIPKIDENTVIDKLDEEGNNTYYVYAKTAATKNYNEGISDIVELTVSNDVASVTTSSGVTNNYTSLDDALNAAQDGDIVTLLSDVDLGETYVTISKSITFDLNGKTLSSSGVWLLYGVLLVKDATVTVKNGTVKAAGDGSCAIRAYRSGSIMTLEDVTATVTSDKSSVTVGDFGSAVIKSGDYQGLYVGAKSQVTLEGGTFRPYMDTITNENVKSIFWKVNETTDATSCDCMELLGDGCVYVDENRTQVRTGGGFNTVVTVQQGTAIDAPVAKIGDVKYASLSKAINAVQNGGTITLLDDLDLGNGAVLQVGFSQKNFTIDLDNHTLSADGACLIMLHNGSQLTLKNGTLDGSRCTSYDGVLYISSNSGPKLTLENVTAKSGSVAESLNDQRSVLLAYVTYGTVEFDGGTYTGGVLLKTDGNAVLKSGTFQKGTNDYSIKTEDSGKHLSDYLDGESLFWKDNAPLDLSNETQTADEVTVRPCEHKWESGKCTVCQKVCDHGGAEGFDESATTCPYCNAPAVAEAALNNGEGNRQQRRFANLQTAIDADRDGGAEFKLLTDVTGDYTINGTQDTALDLYGHSIKGTVTVKGIKGDYITTTLSNTKNTTTASIDKVVACDGAELAGSKYPAVIGELTLAEGATWKTILNGTALGYKVLNADGTHKWYAQDDVKVSQLNNVIINRLPITTKTLNLKVDGKNLTGRSPKVERGTTVQLCASCNTNGANVYIYTGEIVGNNVPTYIQKKAEYQKIGTTWYYVVDLDANTIGTYDIYFTATKDGYSVTSSHKKLTVTKPNLSNAEITFPNGNEAAFNYVTATGVPTFVVTYKGQKLEKDKDYTISSGGSTYDVGPCTLTIKATDNGDYTGSKSAEWTVRPLKVAASVGDIIKTYDGTTDLPANAKITFKSADSYYTGATLRLAKGTDYEVLNARYDSADASQEEKTISFTIRLKNEGYVFEDGKTQKDFTLNGAELEDKAFKINQATVTSPGEITQLVFNDLAKTYTIDLAKLLPKLSEGCAYGSIQYQGCDYHFTDSTYLDGNNGMSVSKEGILTLPTVSAHTSDVNTQIGTITVPVVTTNYQKFEFTIKIYISARIPLNASGVTVSASEITYGQTLNESKLTATGTMKHPGTGEEVKGTFAWKNGTVKPDASDSYEAEWTFTPAAGYEEYAPATGTVTVKVKPAKLTVSVKASRAYYTGEAQIASIIASGQSVDSTPVTFTYSDKVDGDYTSDGPTFTDAGTYTAYYKAEAANHEPATGTFTVTIDPLPISLLSVSSISKTYDGSADVTLTADKLTFFSKAAKTSNIKLPDTALAFSNAQFTKQQADGSYLPSPEVGGGKALSFTMTLISNNYVFEGKSEGTTEVSDVFATDDANRFTITKAAAPTMQPIELTVINGLAKTYLVNLPALPTLGDNCKYGSIKYEACNFDLIGEGGYANSTAMITSNDEFQLTVPAVESQTEGSVGTVGVKITTDNYQDMLLTVEVIAKNKIVPVLDGEITATPITFGQILRVSTITGTMKDDGKTVEGTFEWTDPSTKPDKAGDYQAEWTFTPAEGYEEYATATGTVTIKVNKAAPTFTAPTANALTYTGSEQTLLAAGSTQDGTMMYRLGDSGEFSTEIPTGNDTGTYTVYFKVMGDENHNDAAEQPITVTIDPMKLSRFVLGIDSLTKTYDGTASASLDKDEITFRSNGATVLLPEAAYDITNARFTMRADGSYKDSPEAGDGKFLSFTVTLKSENYVFEGDEGGKTLDCNIVAEDAKSFTITKAAAPAAKAGELTITNGLHETYSLDLSTLLPKLTAPCNYGTITYDKKVVTDLGVGTFITLVDGKTGELTLEANRSGTDEGQFGTITVTISTGNYQDITLTINVIAKNRITPTGTPTLSKNAITYGDALNTIALSGKLHDDVNNVDVDGTFEWVDGTFKPAANDSYQAGWKFTPTNQEKYAEVTGTVTIKVEKATPTGEPKYTAITTSGKTLKDAALTTDGSTLKPNKGKLDWVDDKGNVLPGDTTVEANTTYKWCFTPDDDNYTTLTGEVELYHKSSDGGDGDSYYTIKATAGAGGSISPSGNVSVREGRDQTFTITPDKGYAVANVKIDGESIGAVKSYTFENVRRTHTIEVIFMKANGNPQTGVFVDVATGSYYEEAVNWAVENGITQGTDDTHFSPDGISTRAQAVTFLWRTAGSPEPETRAMPFADVPVGSYYYDAVLWAVENGITKGTSDTTFSPNMACSRAQFVTFLWRSEKSPAEGTANPFADVKSTAYYADAVLWAVKEDITKGTTNTTFSPNADCTRAQIVTFLWRCKK